MNLLKTIFLIILLLIPSVYGIGISYTANELMPITYHPNTVVQRTYYVTGAEQKVAVYVGGDFAKYAVYDHIITTSGPQTPFVITFEFPNVRPKPGFFDGDVTVSQIKGTDSQFSIIAAVNVPFSVRVLDPGKYLETNKLQIEPNHITKGQKTTFTLSATNYGEKKINKARLVVDIKYGNANMKTISSEEKTLESETSHEFKVQWDTKKSEIGQYKAIAKVIYDEKETPVTEDIFYVGDEDIIVNNYTRQLTNDSINKFSLNVMSRWNTPIDYSAALSFIMEGKEIANFKTVNEMLAPWTPKIIDSFVDTRGFELGTYNLNITSFAGTKRLSVHEGRISVVEGKPLVIIQQVETPAKSSYGIVLSLAAVVALLAILNIILFLLYKKKKKR